MAYYSSLFKKNDVRITTKFSTTHKALDLSRGVVRQPIYSGAKLGNGVVSYTATSYTSSGKTWPNSWVVYIKYDNGMTCRMFHGYVADAVVKKGDRVKPGQQVYRTGNTGNSTGDHIHYALINSKGIAIDPTPYVINDQEIIPPDPCVEKMKPLNERIAFLESTLAIREKEYSDLDTDYKRILEEKNKYELQCQEVVKELNGLKEGRDNWINRLADVLHKLFGTK